MGDDWLDNYHFFHALYLLHDLLFEEVPDLLARAGQTRLPELLAMLEDPEMVLKHRLVASEAIARLAREQPDFLPAISAFLQAYLRHIIAHAEQAAQFFPADAGAFGYALEDYLGMLLADVQEAGLRELEPEMRELHRRNLVDESMAGGADDIDFNESNPLPPSPDIFARYQLLRDNPENYSPFHPDAAGIARRRAEQEAKYAQMRRAAMPQQPRLVLPKIGRNDPCPCGSGKKYKKCCGA